MFEEASRLKLRFSYKGSISVEDLWDLSAVDLDSIYKALSRVRKSSSSEDSLIVTSTKDDKINDLKIDIVKHIFNVKQEERDKKEKRTARLAKKRQMQAILANKQNEELQNKSADELAKLIDELDED